MPPVVLLAGGYTGPQPTYQQSPNWAIHVQLALEARLRTAGFIARPVPFAAVSSHFDRPPAEQPVAVVMMCGDGIDPSLSRLLETLPHGPRVFYAANVDEPMCLGADTVAIDHAAGGQALVDWLVAKNRRTLQRVWFQVWSHSQTLPPWLARRDEGMRAAADRHGLTLPPVILVPWLRTPPRSDQFVHYWQLGVFALAGALAPTLFGPQPYDGLLMMHDTGAVQAWSSLAHLGDDVADRVLVTGHDDLWSESPEYSFQPRPPSVTIGRDMRAVGEALADLILARLGGTAPSGRQTRLITPQLVVPPDYSGSPI